MDQIISSIDTRFNDAQDIIKYLSFLSPENIILHKDANQILPCDCFDNLSIWLTDLNLEQLKTEYTIFPKSFNELLSGLNLSSELHNLEQ